MNGTVIAASVVAREAQHHRAASPAAAWHDAARALAVRELLLQRARALEMTPEPRTQDGGHETDEEALIRALLEREVRTPVADDAACHRYYEAQRPRFRAPDLFEPVHILFRARRDDAEAYAQATAKAEAVLAELADHPDRFEALARSLSHCSSAADGGRLGQVTRGDTTPEFETFLLALEPGQICPRPIHTRYGVHVLRLDRKIAGEELPFEAVRDRIADYLQQRTWRRAVAQYIALLAGQASISGVDLPAAASPLVQ